MDSYEKFEETCHLKKRVHDLTQEPTTEEEYKHAQRVWETMGCRTMGDYHDVYLLILRMCLKIFAKFA